jgi:TonB-linked SusC/RagA family outer membrane protein
MQLRPLRQTCPEVGNRGYALCYALMMTFGILFTSMPSFAAEQEKTISLKEKNITLIRLFELVRKQTGYTFLYEKELVSKTSPISIEVREASVTELLDKYVKPHHIVYEIRYNTVILSAETPPVKKVPAGKTSERLIRGKVTDEKGDPLPGVSIKIRGTMDGTLTDPNGDFEVTLPEEQGVLIFSFVGFETLEEIVGTRSALEVILKPSSSTLNEVVVVGYGTQLQKDVTGSIATIGQERFRDLPVSSIDQKIIGQVAGVQIQQLSGTPGGGTSVKIRGSGSLGAGNEPLYVVDGIPFASGLGQNFNPLIHLNPNDIESVTILKDASSTAIYGSRGANGVIMVTTKKGKFDRTEVTFSSSTGIQQVPQKGRPEMLNAREFAELQRDRIDLSVRRQEGREPVLTDYPVEYRDLESLKGNGTDWYGMMLRKAVIQDHNFSLAKGSKDSRFVFNLGYLKQDGVLRNTGLERYSGKLGIDNRIGNFTITAALQPAFVKQNRASTNDNREDIIGVAIWANPIATPYDENGNLKPYITSPQSKYHSAWSFANPLFRLQEIEQVQEAFQNIGTVSAEWEILPGLRAKTSLNTILTSSRYSGYVPATVGAANRPPLAGTGSSANVRQNGFNWVLENTVHYQKAAKGHSFNILAGYTTQKSTDRSISLNAGPFANDLIRTINAAQAISSWGEGVEKWSMISYLGRINYSYRDRYLLTATIRSDGSSRFGSENRFALFPSVAAGWRISEENFLKNAHFVSNLKLRASYGRSGNNNIGNYSHVASVNAGSYIFGSSQVTASSVGLSNPILGWEESEQVDLGLESTFFKDRVTFTADVYRRKSINMLLNDVIPAITGFNNQTVNKGGVRNNGVELDLGVLIAEGVVNWSANANVAFNRNKIVSTNENGDRILSGNEGGRATHVSEVGKPIGQFFGYILEGVYSAADLTNPSVPKYPTVFEGAPKYRDVNGDGIITDVLDYTAIGNPHPKFIYGFRNNISYKGIDLSVNVNGQYGGQVMNGLRSTTDNLYGLFNVGKEWVNRWRSAANPGDGIHSGAVPSTPNIGWRASTLWVEDASYLRISNVTLGYNLPQELLRSTRYINNLRLYVSVQNLATFTRYLGANPEGQQVGINNTLSPGFDMTTYPLARTASAGISVTF